MKFVALTFLVTLLSIPSLAKLPKVNPGDPLPSNLFVELAKLINPTVVNISTTQLPKGRSHQDPYQQFLEEFFGPRYRGGMQRQPAQSLGTGFVIRKDGLIVTNNHVIDKADVIKVQLEENDDTLYEATVIGKDARTDIALIKIKVDRDLPVAKLGTSTDLSVGEWVAAFGNPYGHGHTMTKGIVSAKGRNIDVLNKFSFIQTDASINPGNSGGPLVNMRGEVVGVNTAIDARAQGIGFAIPIDDVKEILPNLEKDGKIRRGFLGVGIADITPQVSKSLNLSSKTGALVTQVYEDSPASKSDIRPYDVFVEFNGNKVNTAQDLARTVQDTTAGKTYNAKIERDGKVIGKKIKVEENPQSISRQSPPTRRSLKSVEARHGLGFKMIDHNKRVVEDWNLPKVKGAPPIIIDVNPRTPAGIAGLVAGDMILDVNRQKVRRAADVNRYLKKNSINLMRILRNNSVALVQLRPAK
ncbi:MAG: serine protease MucD [Bdellovibrionaceae bacterium]|nr:serine protease MucD [Pseudobdellovibrionaceae bacterium]|tara:strand:- start:54095 stop:55504 length:1410 start_codon:yes stop_codon:yes gene_type:complete